MARNNNTNNSSGNAAGTRGAKKGKAKRQPRTGGPRGGSAPASVGTGYIAQGPAVVRSVGPTVRFSNTEFVSDIVAPATTVTSPVLTVNLNPANSSFTAWLSRIAVGYELYRFTRLVFRYTPTCSSSTNGMVVMAIDYDASDAPPNTKQTISAYEGASRGNVWSKLSTTANPTAGWYYVGLTGGTSNPANTDIKFYDIGKLYVGVYNQASGIGTVGEISVDYTVEFARPDFSIPPGLSEMCSPSDSTITNMVGSTGVTIGNNVFSVSNGTPGIFYLTANTTGDFLLSLIGYYTSNAVLSNPVNPFNTISQTDPTGYTQNVPWVDYMVSGNVANTQAAYTIMTPVRVVQGSRLMFALLGSITASQLLRMRIASYKKDLS